MLYRVLAPMTLHSGLLGLTPPQAQARSFGLVAEGALWRVVKPVGFKAGELIEHDGQIPKAHAQTVAEAGADALGPAEGASQQPKHAKRRK